MPAPRVVILRRRKNCSSSPRTKTSWGILTAGFSSLATTGGGARLGGSTAGFSWAASFSLAASQAVYQASRSPADQSARATCVTWGNAEPIPGTPGGAPIMSWPGSAAHNLSLGSFTGGGAGGQTKYLTDIHAIRMTNDSRKKTTRFFCGMG